MRFRLTYEGRLRASQPEGASDQPLSPKQQTLNQHKHQIRREFHGQLKQLWETDKFLREAKVIASEYTLSRRAESTFGRGSVDPSGLIPMLEEVANRYERGKFKFVPLVREDHHLACSLSILFLRRDPPGSVIKAGDIDNRLKTLIDALAMPVNSNQVSADGPQDGEEPFFCLLEDDSQITHIDLEADRLLDPPVGDKADAAWVRVIITATIRPYYVTMDNLSYG